MHEIKTCSLCRSQALFLVPPKKWKCEVNLLKAQVFLLFFPSLLLEAPEPMDVDGPKGNGYIKTELISVSEV